MSEEQITREVGEQFDDAEQQRQAVGLGIWTFLTTEVLFFGGLFLGYAVYRHLYPHAFAEASRHLYKWIGATNTAVLLISSCMVALAVRSAHLGDRKLTVRFLRLTVLLGLCFMALKATEYALDIREGLVPGAGFRGEEFSDPKHAQLFYLAYWIMTGLHAVHVTAGVGVLFVISILVGRQPVEHRANTVEAAGLYWHFVDIIWIFLLPLLYLVQ